MGFVWQEQHAAVAEQKGNSSVLTFYPDSGCAAVGNCMVVQLKQLLSRIPGPLLGYQKMSCSPFLPQLSFHLLNPQLLEAWFVWEDICYTG